MGGGGGTVCAKKGTEKEGRGAVGVKWWGEGKWKGDWDGIN